MYYISRYHGMKCLFKLSVSEGEDAEGGKFKMSKGTKPDLVSIILCELVASMIHKIIVG